MFGRRKRITNLEKIRRRMTQHEIAVLISDSFCYCPKHRDGVVACSKVSCYGMCGKMATGRSGIMKRRKTVIGEYTGTGGTNRVPVTIKVETGGKNETLSLCTNTGAGISVPLEELKEVLGKVGMK